MFRALAFIAMFIGVSCAGCAGEFWYDPAADPTLIEDCERGEEAEFCP